MRIEMTDAELRARPSLREASGEWVLGICMLAGAFLLLATRISVPLFIGNTALLGSP